MLDDLGLNVALGWLAQDVLSTRGLEVRVHVGDDDLPTDVGLAIAIYRLTETALEHFAMHVEAGIAIELRRHPNDWVLRFQSEPGHARPGGDPAALMAMTEAFDDQVHLLGARVERSEDSHGIQRLTVFIGEPLAPSTGAGR